MDISVIYLKEISFSLSMHYFYSKVTWYYSSTPTIVICLTDTNLLGGRKVSISTWIIVNHTNFSTDSKSMSKVFWG